MIINKRLVTVWFVLAVIASGSLRAQLQMPLVSSKPSAISISLSNSPQVKRLDQASNVHLPNIYDTKTSSSLDGERPLKKKQIQKAAHSAQPKSTAYAKHNKAVKKKNKVSKVSSKHSTAKAHNSSKKKHAYYNISKQNKKHSKPRINNASVKKNTVSVSPGCKPVKKHSTAKPSMNGKASIDSDTSKVSLDNYSSKVSIDNYTAKASRGNYNPKVSIDNYAHKASIDNHNSTVTCRPLYSSAKKTSSSVSKRGHTRTRVSGQWKPQTSWPAGVRKQHVQTSRKKRRRSAHRNEQVSVIRRSRPARSEFCEPDIQPAIKKEPIRLVKPGSRVKPTQAHISWRKTQQEGLFYWPVEPKNFYISSQFGPRRKANGRPGFHAGLDMAAITGTAVRAAAGGTVVEAHYSRGYGNYILIAHPRQFKTRYAHLDKILVKVGQKVKAGEHIGKVGATGYVRKSRWGGSGSHLHFEVYKASKPVNPYLFLA